jgi:hypothetical protein
MYKKTYIYKRFQTFSFWEDKLCLFSFFEFCGKSGPDFSPIRPIFPRACSIANKVCTPCASTHSRLVLEQAHLLNFGFFQGKVLKIFVEP